ncbi:MAG: adenosine deaminase [Anaerolineae bacterium]
MTLAQFIREMPKVELHVHMEGAIQPETVLKLAARNHIALPADSVEGLRAWYSFTDFPHFVQIYVKISECLQTADDIEFMAREFLKGQAAQNIRYSEVTYTPYTHYMQKGLAFAEQLAALNRARAWAEAELGVTMRLITDISRNVTPEQGMVTAQWAVSAKDDGVAALGLGGPEVGHPAEKHAAAFEYAWSHGLPCILHAGETDGAPSIWGAIKHGRTLRIGHGVRCLEDRALVDYLREKQIPLEVSPSSNVCLKVFPSLGEHALPKLMAEGLYVTLNSDDPPMFNTTLTDEYLRCADAFGWNADLIEKLVFDALREVSLLPEKA